MANHSFKLFSSRESKHHIFLLNDGKGSSACIFLGVGLNFNQLAWRVMPSSHSVDSSNLRDECLLGLLKFHSSWTSVSAAVHLCSHSPFT